VRGLGRIAATLGTAVVVAGCGSLGPGEETERVDEPQFLTGRDIARQAEGSPARTVLEWWRALQFDNPVVAYRYYAGQVKRRLSQRELGHQIGFGPGLLNLQARPKVSDVEQEGDEATVFLLMTQVKRNPNGRTDETLTARSFNLVREDGEWKLADNRYLARYAGNAEAFFAGGQEGQDGQSRRGQSGEDQPGR
jgi:hypothetical protein